MRGRTALLAALLVVVGAVAGAGGWQWVSSERQLQAASSIAADGVQVARDVDAVCTAGGSVAEALERQRPGTCVRAERIATADPPAPSTPTASVDTVAIADSVFRRLLPLLPPGPPGPPGLRGEPGPAPPCLDLPLRCQAPDDPDPDDPEQQDPDPNDPDPVDDPDPDDPDPDDPDPNDGAVVGQPGTPCGPDGAWQWERYELADGRAAVRCADPSPPTTTTPIPSPTT